MNKIRRGPHTSPSVRQRARTLGNVRTAASPFSPMPPVNRAIVFGTEPKKKKKENIYRYIYMYVRFIWSLTSIFNVVIIFMCGSNSARCTFVFREKWKSNDIRLIFFIIDNTFRLRLNHKNISISRNRIDDDDFDKVLFFFFLWQYIIIIRFVLRPYRISYKRALYWFRYDVEHQTHVLKRDRFKRVYSSMLMDSVTIEKKPTRFSGFITQHIILFYWVRI